MRTPKVSPIPQRLLTILEQEPGLTAGVLARRCGLSTQVIRRHLQSLVIEGRLLSKACPVYANRRLYFRSPQP